MSYGYPGGDPNQGGYGQSGPQQPGGYGGGYDPNQGGYGQSGPQQPGGYGTGGYGGGYGTGGGYGGGGYGTGGGQPPSNWLIPAIISILCCWPLAIPSIIFATQVNSKWAAGDYAGAEDSAKKAKTFSIIAFCLGAVWVIIWLILALTGAFTANSYSSSY